MSRLSSLSISETVPGPLRLGLLLLAPATYLTSLGIVPGVANNIGPFEVVAALIIGFTMLHGLRFNWRVRGHFLTRILALIALVAGANLYKLSDRPLFGITQWLLLLYGLCLLIVFLNLVLRYPGSLRVLLRLLAYCAVIAAIWVTADGFQAAEITQASGPFRNRVHVGIYMVSSFWLVLLYLNLPRVSTRERALLLLALPLIVYGITISGRRSVYLALGMGILLLLISVIFLYPRERGRTMLILIVGVGFLILLYLQRDLPFIPDTLFFQERVLTIEDRLRAFAGDDEVLADDDNFILLQRQGMIAAVQDYPLLGLGWGGFFESPYSPTGHEMHSTPQKFLAELGLVGFALYLLFSGYLLFGSLRLLRRARQTEYQLSAMMLTIALWSLHLSWAYNRSITDRTYWLLIIIFMGFEILVERVQPAGEPQRRRARTRAAQPALNVSREQLS